MEPISIGTGKPQSARERREFYDAAETYAAEIVRTTRTGEAKVVFTLVRLRERFINAYKLMVLK
jgi:hypothetical protein